MLTFKFDLMLLLWHFSRILSKSSISTISSLYMKYLLFCRLSYFWANGNTTGSWSLFALVMLPINKIFASFSSIDGSILFIFPVVKYLFSKHEHTVTWITFFQFNSDFWNTKHLKFNIYFFFFFTIFFFLQYQHWPPHTDFLFLKPHISLSLAQDSAPVGE